MFALYYNNVQKQQSNEMLQSYLSFDLSTHDSLSIRHFHVHGMTANEFTFIISCAVLHDFRN
jgi:hypothetical protein